MEFNRILFHLKAWFDGDFITKESLQGKENNFHLSTLLSLIFLHLGCLLVFVVGVSKVAIYFALIYHFAKKFFITGFYHRYFAHRSYKTSRVAQFIFAALGNLAVQRGALWWAAHHRKHHATADTKHDEHSPIYNSFLKSHMLWFTLKKNYPTKYNLVKDFTQYKELVFLNRFDWLVPVISLLLMYSFGEYLNYKNPSLHTSGMQIIVWGFFVTTVTVFHFTGFINSLAHRFGKQDFPSNDSSRNNFLTAVITFGEGWHNNHHFYPVAMRQGFYWWQIDIGLYLLKILQLFGIIWDVKTVPKEVLAKKI